jgi:endonuclease III
LKEQETGKPAQILGADHETSEQKDDELALFQETLLNLDYISKLDVDEAMEELIKLPGIGVKTASCVILFRMQIPSFAVDTHVHRLCNWLGWVPAGTSRDKTFSHCEVRVPDHLKYSLHQLFIRHGKKCYRCRAVTSAGTQEWDETVCPIEHLVKRLEPKKQPGYKPPAKAQKGGKGKGKKANEEVEDSDVEMSDEE